MTALSFNRLHENMNITTLIGSFGFYILALLISTPNESLVRMRDLHQIRE